MINWLKANHGWITNILAIAAPVVVGVVTGGVFTLPVIVTAIGVVVGKFAQSPLPPPIPVAASQLIDAVKQATGK